MKLIIDISDKMFDTFKKTGIMAFDSLDEYDKDILANILANGLPYEDRSQGEFVKLLKDRIEKSVCKRCQMNKHCELCEISRVFMIIDLTDIDMNGGAK